MMMKHFITRNKNKCFLSQSLILDVQNQKLLTFHRRAGSAEPEPKLSPGNLLEENLLWTYREMRRERVLEEQKASPTALESCQLLQLHLQMSM